MYALGAYLKWYEYILRVGMIKFIKRRIIQASNEAYNKLVTTN